MAEEPDDTTPSGAPDPPHDDGGLDYARAAARAASKAPGGAPAKRRGGPASDADKRQLRRRGSKGRGGSGAHPDERDPQLLEGLVERMVRSHGWELDLRVQQVFGRWAEIVGAEVADHCRPETLADGRLVVRTDATAWATQLKLMAPTLVRRLNEELGHGTVTVIEVLGPHLPSWKRGPRSVRDGRGPRDTYG